MTEQHAEQIKGWQIIELPTLSLCTRLAESIWQIPAEGQLSASSTTEPF